MKAGYTDVRGEVAEEMTARGSGLFIFTANERR